MTSEKVSSLRTLSDLPIEMRTVAEVRPADSAISRASAAVGAKLHTPRSMARRPSAARSSLGTCALVLFPSDPSP